MSCNFVSAINNKAQGLFTVKVFKYAVIFLYLFIYLFRFQLICILIEEKG